jgi:flagellar biosynthesis component FlhA
MHKMIKHPLAILSVSAGLLCVPVLANAEAASTQPATPATQQTQVQVSEEKIDQFVTAYVEVQKINKEYSEQLQTAEEPEKATELQQEAQTKMQKAVTDTGLTIPEYQQIASLAGQDAELRSRIQEGMAN